MTYRYFLHYILYKLAITSLNVRYYILCNVSTKYLEDSTLLFITEHYLTNNKLICFIL